MGVGGLTARALARISSLVTVYIRGCACVCTSRFFESLVEISAKESPTRLAVIESQGRARAESRGNWWWWFASERACYLFVYWRKRGERGVIVQPHVLHVNWGECWFTPSTSECGSYWLASIWNIGYFYNMMIIIVVWVTIWIVTFILKRAIMHCSLLKTRIWLYNQIILISNTMQGEEMKRAENAFSTHVLCALFVPHSQFCNFKKKQSIKNNYEHVPS